VTEDEEDFRVEVLGFLRATLPPKGAAVETGGTGVTRAVAFQHALAQARLAGITWPTEYGGRGLPGRFQRIFDREAKAFQVPPRALEIGLGMCGPTLLVHASEEQKRALIPPLLRGEHIWCELFSEPGAGSDLSSVQTQARLDGDVFVLDGQKVWTSGAQHSDYAACLTRSDPARPKREGITMLIVDMHAPGITVRPLRQITGDAHFNEVFLDGVRVPVANVLGDVHDGWRVVRTMLAFEREALGGLGSGGGGKGGFAALAAEAKRRGVSARPELRDRLAHPAPGANGQPGTPMPAVGLPVITYNNEIVFNMDGDEIHLIPIPRAHTDGDTMVYFAKNDILMTGDFYRSLGYPNIDRANGGSMNGMLAGLARIVALCGPKTRIVPGHGDMVNRDAVQFHRDMMMAVRDKVSAMVDQGKSQQDVVAAKLTAEFDPKVPGGAGMTADRFVGQLYAELKAAK